MRNKKEIETFPSRILCDRTISPLEAVSEYLREIKEYNYHEAGILLKRDERTVWTCYNRAKNKRKKESKQKKNANSIQIPVSIFQNRLFSSLEVVVVYLKEKKNMTYHEIGVLLNRNERTIWTCYSRSCAKETAERRGESA